MKNYKWNQLEKTTQVNLSDYLVRLRWVHYFQNLVLKTFLKIVFLVVEYRAT